MTTILATVAPEVHNFRRTERRLIAFLRRALDRADEILHGWELATREAAAPVCIEPAADAAQTAPERIQEAPQRIKREGLTWEQIHAENAKPAPAKPRKRRRTVSAADFDLRFASQA
jgi:hypothetical protein